MFGKLANPDNLMYSKDTVIYPVNEISSVFMKGVQLRYAGGDSEWYIFSLSSESRFPTVNSPSRLINTNVDTVGNSNNAYYTYIPGYFNGSDHFIVLFNKRRISNLILPQR